MALQDHDAFPYGKYAGRIIRHVPASYLFNHCRDGGVSPEVAEYIRRNYARIREDKKRELQACTYFRIPKSYKEGLDVFPCRVLVWGEEYCTCELFHDDKMKRSKGIFNDVCRNDIEPFQNYFSK